MVAGIFEKQVNECDLQECKGGGPEGEGGSDTDRHMAWDDTRNKEKGTNLRSIFVHRPSATSGGEAALGQATPTVLSSMQQPALMGRLKERASD